MHLGDFFLYACLMLLSFLDLVYFCAADETVLAVIERLVKADVAR